MEQNLHSITGEKIIAQTENEVSLEFSIPEESDFFDGHFPEYKLLPAVAQFEIITRFSRKYFGTERYVPDIRRIKFSAPIRPNAVVRLRLHYKADKGAVAFTMADAAHSDKVYSSGSFSAVCGRA